MNRFLLRAAVAGAILLPAVARAQVERLAGRLAEPTRAAVVAVVDSARAAGLPAGPLVNKALEGASKGAGGPQIVAAVRALAGEMGDARAAIGPAATAGELVAGAAALRAGMTPVALRQLRADDPRASLVVPLAVMADLVARGVPADTAAASVLALAGSGEQDADLVAFRQSVERDIALGAPPGGAAAALTAATAPVAATIPGNSTPPPRPRRP